MKNAPSAALYVPYMPAVCLTPPLQMDDTSPASTSRFTALEVEMDSSSDRPAVAPSRRLGRWHDSEFLRKLLFVEAVVIVAVLAAMAGLAAHYNGGGGGREHDKGFGPEDPRGSLPHAVTVEALMRTLRDLEGVAMQHNGTRCVEAACSYLGAGTPLSAAALGFGNFALGLCFVRSYLRRGVDRCTRH